MKQKETLKPEKRHFKKRCLRSSLSRVFSAVMVGCFTTTSLVYPAPEDFQANHAKQLLPRSNFDSPNRVGFEKAVVRARLYRRQAPDPLERSPGIVRRLLSFFPFSFRWLLIHAPILLIQTVLGSSRDKRIDSVLSQKVSRLVNPEANPLTVYYPGAGDDVQCPITATDASRYVFLDLGLGLLGLDIFEEVRRKLVAAGASDLSMKQRDTDTDVFTFMLKGKGADGKLRSCELIYYKNKNAQSFLPPELADGYDVLFAKYSDLSLRLIGAADHQLMRLPLSKLRPGGRAVMVEGYSEGFDPLSLKMLGLGQILASFSVAPFDVSLFLKMIGVRIIVARKGAEDIAPAVPGFGSVFPAVPAPVAVEPAQRFSDAIAQAA